MSYCRFGEGDVYVYAAEDGWIIHYRRAEDEWIIHYRRAEDEWIIHCRRSDGGLESSRYDSPGEAADRLERLKSAGASVPAHNLRELRADQCLIDERGAFA